MGIVYFTVFAVTFFLCIQFFSWAIGKRHRKEKVAAEVED